MRSRNLHLLVAAAILAGCAGDNGGMWPPEAWPVELRSEKHQAQAARAEQARKAAQAQQAWEAEQWQKQQQQAQQWRAYQGQQAQPAPPSPASALSIRERMRELKALYLEHLITPAEYETKKAQVLNEL